MNWSTFLPKIIAKTSQVIAAPSSWAHLQIKRSQCLVDARGTLHPSSTIVNHQQDPSAITVGANTHIRGELLVCAHGGKIHIGDTCFVGEGSRIWSASSVRIGNRVLISHSVNIHDNDSHSPSAESRHKHFGQIIEAGHPNQLDDVATAPVLIEDDSWIGFGSAIFRGVTIGRGAVVSAGSVVIRDVAPYCVVAGNPAHTIGRSRE